MSQIRSLTATQRTFLTGRPRAGLSEMSGGERVGHVARVRRHRGSASSDSVSTARGPRSPADTDEKSSFSDIVSHGVTNFLLESNGRE